MQPIIKEGTLVVVSTSFVPGGFLHDPDFVGVIQELRKRENEIIWSVRCLGGKYIEVDQGRLFPLAEVSSEDRKLPVEAIFSKYLPQIIATLCRMIVQVSQGASIARFWSVPLD